MAFLLAGRLNFHGMPLTCLWSVFIPEETMNTEDYQNLIRRFCEQERLDPDDLLRDGLLTVDGRRVAIHFEPGISADHILVRAELGEIPAFLRPQCHRSMLTANHRWGLGGTTFSVPPDSEEAVLTSRLAVHPSMAAPELRHAFDALGVLFRHWSNTVEDLHRNLSQP